MRVWGVLFCVLPVRPWCRWWSGGVPSPTQRLSAQLSECARRVTAQTPRLNVATRCVGCPAQLKATHPYTTRPYTTFRSTLSPLVPCFGLFVSSTNNFQYNSQRIPAPTTTLRRHTPTVSRRRSAPSMCPHEAWILNSWGIKSFARSGIIRSALMMTK